MAGRDLVVIGGSAGALQALTRLVESIPSWIDATFLVAVHRSADHPGAMPGVLARHGPLPASFAVDGEALRRGHIYVAPPDHHLLVSGERMRVTRGPREHGFRPAVDPLFRTAAREYGPRTVGLLLSGVLDDGVEGLALIKRHGGVAIVQRPEDAEHRGMPTSALETVDVDHVLPAASLGPVLARLADEVVPFGLPVRVQDVSERGDTGLRTAPPPGALQPFACPECGGALWQSHPAGRARFRCHLGHAFTARTPMALQDGKLEQALWTALRNLEEHAALRRRLAARARGSALEKMADVYEREARRSEEQATMLRDVLIASDVASLDTAERENAVESSPGGKVSRQSRHPVL
jgi:two-component system chemotaxis response regulator CheB